MLLADMICPKAIVTDLGSTNRDAVIRELVGALADAGCFSAEKADEIASAVIHRENALGTTGLGQGVAIPHARTDALETPTVAIGIAGAGVDFDAMDNQPVTIVFLLASPNNPEQHLRAMDAIIRHLHQSSLRTALRHATDPRDVLDILRQSNHRNSA